MCSSDLAGRETLVGAKEKQRKARQNDIAKHVNLFVALRQRGLDAKVAPFGLLAENKLHDQSTRVQAYKAVATSGEPLRRRTPRDGWTTRTGRSPGCGSSRDSAFPVSFENQWQLESRSPLTVAGAAAVRTLTSRRVPFEALKGTNA